MSTPSPSPMIRCESLVRFYDTASGRIQAVRGVDVEIGSRDSGTVAAVIGPSGCGKSSLLRMIAGIDSPTAGLVAIDGVDLYQLGEAKRAKTRGRLLTHVHQRPSDNLFGHLNVLQHLQRVEGPGLSSDDALERLRLTSVSRSLPRQLSGGEQQRLAFATALVAGHRVVIADEPTSQLDAASAEAVLDAIDTLAAAKVTVLIATHDERVLDRVDHVLSLRDGAVASVSTAGTEWAVIDRAGRIQLPPTIREKFPNRRARLVWDDNAGSARVEPT